CDRSAYRQSSTFACQSGLLPPGRPPARSRASPGSGGRCDLAANFGRYARFGGTLCGVDRGVRTRVRPERAVAPDAMEGHVVGDAIFVESGFLTDLQGAVYLPDLIPKVVAEANDENGQSRRAV